MTFDEANRKIIDAIREALKAQGHYDTGALDASFESSVDTEGRMLVMSASSLEYLEQLEHGVPADQINISSSEFQKLKGWVRRRALAGNDDEATRVAAAIVTKWKKEGMPTEGSKAFSETGSRTDAVRDAFENDNSFTGFIDQAAIGSLDAQFSTIKSGLI